MYQVPYITASAVLRTMSETLKELVDKHRKKFDEGVLETIKKSENVYLLVPPAITELSVVISLLEESLSVADEHDSHLVVLDEDVIKYIAKAADS